MVVDPVGAAAAEEKAWPYLLQAMQQGTAVPGTGGLHPMVQVDRRGGPHLSYSLSAVPRTCPRSLELAGCTQRF